MRQNTFISGSAIGIALLFCAAATMAQSDQSENSQHVVVVLDNSGSMKRTMRNNQVDRMTAAKQSLKVVLQSLPADSHVGIVLLNGNRGQNWIVPLGPIDIQAATTAIDSIKANGGTPLGRFMKIGADSLLESRGKDHYGGYRLLIVTDGEAGDQNSVEQYLPDILARGITTDVIGVDMKGDHSLATKVHTYRRADDPESLTQAVREVFAETTSDANDTGEDDFDLVAGLPDDFATAALEALAASGNHPIGTRASVLSGSANGGGNASGNGNSASATSNTGPGYTALPSPNSSNNGQNGGRNEPRRGRPNMFIIAIGLIVLFNIVKAVFRGGSSGRRNR